MKLILSGLMLMILSVSEAGTVDLTVLNINEVGPESLSQAKQIEAVDWWLEMGDKMVVATAQKELKWPSGITVDQIIRAVDIDNLAFHVMGHCDHSEQDDIFHHRLDVIYAGQTARLVNLTGVNDKSALLKHDSLFDFSKNKVLSYQAKNRQLTVAAKNNRDVQTLIDQVDQNRWFSQVEYLAGFDRMLEADLITTGNWLENKFLELGFSTSRVSLNQFHRGTNVLGFKQGTTRPDDWYVVGAHMDSRNRDRNDNLPSPGAEDNASGCSAVLEIANVIGQYDTEASIFFMCFIEEEQGLLGSRDVVTYLTDNGDINKVQAMYNLDMISYRGPNRNSAIVGTNDNDFQNLANTVAANGNLYTDINWSVNLNMCCTDFVSFSAADVPAVTTNQPDISSYAGYHTTQDLASNLDPILAAGIIQTNLVTLADSVGVDFSSSDLIFEDGFE